MGIAHHTTLGQRLPIGFFQTSNETIRMDCVFTWKERF